MRYGPSRHQDNKEARSRFITRVSPKAHNQICLRIKLIRNSCSTGSSNRHFSSAIWNKLEEVDITGHVLAECAGMFNPHSSKHSIYLLTIVSCNGHNFEYSVMQCGDLIRDAIQFRMRSSSDGWVWSYEGLVWNILFLFFDGQRTLWRPRKVPPIWGQIYTSGWTPGSTQLQTSETRCVCLLLSLFWALICN